MKIVCLTENTAVNGCTSEHGLSLFIDTDDVKLLFDMGQTDLFAKNAQQLSVDLSKVDVAVLSHGHYDHGGGLKSFIEINDTAPVYIPQNAFVKHYNGQTKYIGLDKELLSNKRLITVYEDTKIFDGITIINYKSVPQKHKFGCFGLKKELNGVIVDDDFDHEQYLLIERDNKRVLISGCSHRGIINIVEAIKPDIVIGGFHTSKMELDDELSTIGKKLSQCSCTFFTCHCTGEKQFEYLKKHVDRLYYLSCGQKIII